METHLSYLSCMTGNRIRLWAITLFLISHITFINGSPADWMFFFEETALHSDEEGGFGNKPLSLELPVALSCLPEVNVSLGLQGYAVITSIMLVNAPAYPPFQYDVDIMGPLNDTVFCEQVGLELMVVVTELPTGNSCMSTIFIEDKLDPVLTCTPDILPCNTDIASIDFEDYLDSATDNCDDDLNLFYQYTVQNLPCNPNGYTQQIAVLWTAIDDSGNSTTCQDIIYLQRPPLADIDFPADVTLSCVNANIDPSNTGVPTYLGEPIGASCQFIVTHTDQVVPMCTGAQKIIRLWSVMNMCTGATRTDAQEILLIDNVPPSLICPANVTIGTSPGVCTTKYTLPMPVVSDACATTATIDIDIFVSGVPGIFSPGNMVTLGLGTTTITIRATDPCGNSSMCSYNVTVRDNTPPIPVCHSLTVGLGPDGMAFLVAANLNFPVIENCGILSKEIWRMTNSCGVPGDLLPGPDVKFCCEDAGDTLMVVFKVTDLSGNMNTCMFEVIVKDQLPPVISCEDLTVSIENGGNIVIDPADVVGNASDNCFIVDTIVTPGIFDCDDIGENIVIVTVVDQSGNSSSCTATVTIVDAVPPVAECEDITVTLGAGGTVTITTDQIDDGSSDNCAIDTMFLNEYEFDCTEAGINIVTLTVVDEGGNTATCTATVTVLTTPPVAICQDITVQLNESGIVIITADQVDNGSFDDCGIDTITVTPATFDCDDIGENTVTLTVTDLSGNVSTCTAVVTVEDDLPPIALCQDISVMLDDNGMATITATQINNGSTDNCTIITLAIDTFQFDCEDAGPNVVTLTVTDQSGNTATCTAIVFILMPDPPMAICQDITVTLGPDGTVTITPADIDNGSFAQCGDLTFALDQDSFDCTETGDNIVILTVTDETGATATCTATVTVEDNTLPVCNASDITVSLDADGEVSITAGDVNDGSTDNCDIISLSVTPADFDCDDIGPNTVTLTVTDQSGNSSTCTAIVTVQDVIPPIAICQNITVTLNADGIVVLTGIEINNNSTDNCDSLGFTATPDTLTCEDLGPNVVILTVTDLSGNISTCSAIVNVTLDPPTASCQDITVSLDANGIVTITPGQVDNGSGSNCGDLDFSLSEDQFDCTELGPNIVILTVTDGAGNTSTCTATVTVVDDMDPICNAADITVSLDGNGEVSITAGDVNDGSADNCDIVILTVTPLDFDCDDIGPNVVTLTVTDQSGNTSTCTAIVTVQDLIPPVAICQDITVALNGDGIVVLTVIEINNNSTDNCDSVAFTATPDTLTCEDLGVNVVILTVIDEAGNVSTCSANVTVTSLPPVASCQDITVSLDANGVITIAPGQVDDGSSSNCGDLDLSLDENTFDCTELGNNIVILTVTDESGATATCTATVTVVDDMDPICNAADITVFLDENGIVTITAGDVNDGSTDNCDIVSLTVTPDDFTCDDAGPNTVTLTVTDQSGNSSTCTSTVTVVDTIAPFCATQNITVSLVGNIVTITATQVNNGSTDNCGPVTLNVNPATFDCDDLGPNVVVLTVTDEEGNSSTCTATVTVEETAGGLVANCQNVTIFVDANGNASVDPEDVNNGSGGGCENDSLTFDLSQTDFNCTDLGPNVVILTVTDDEGNTATCTAIVTVADIIPPTIDCPDNVTVNCDEVINPNNTAQFGSATGLDNCPPVSIQENAVFNLNDCNVGTIIRTFVASDASGNTASCVQIVTITNTNPFTEDDITWPASPISINICNSTDPNNIPNGTPVFDPASLQCANPVATFADQVQTIIDNDPNTPCRIITRTWTVTDNCQPGVTFMFVQTINVIDVTPPSLSNINNMTKVANENCVAFFTLIASATDCAGVTITNNSPYGATTGANASGNYPIGQTVVIFTATDGCGNTSTMDVIITVTDPDPTEFLCEKVIVILPPELDIVLCAHIFITFLPGTCSDANDFIISYSNTNPYDTCRLYDCGDVGVSTFSLWFWDLAGTMVVDSCDNADLDLRDPDDNCQDGLVLTGNVVSENGQAVSDIVVKVTNAPMQPAMTDDQGAYQIEGLNKGEGYEIAPFNDAKHREGVSTLDLVMIQKHLLGRAQLNSPYKMIAADANKSGHISAFDILEIRKLILGINTRFPSNTSWRFVDKNYLFPDEFNPFNQPFAEFIWIDSVLTEITNADFIGVKIGDVNGSYFQRVTEKDKIVSRSATNYELIGTAIDKGSAGIYNAILVKQAQGRIDGLQFSIQTDGLTEDQLKHLESDVLKAENWYYDPISGAINVSWSVVEEEDLSGKVILSWPVGNTTSTMSLHDIAIQPEAYQVSGEVYDIRKVTLNNEMPGVAENFEYNLFQNKPNPFVEGTVISFSLPKAESVKLTINDMSGREVFTYEGRYEAGYHEIPIQGRDLRNSGIYYYTLYTETASLTRKMSFTNN